MTVKVSTKSRGHGGDAERPLHEPSEFSRVVEVADIPAAGLDLTIRADSAECTALARRAGLVAVSNLSADFHLQKRKRSEVEVTGLLRARIVQTCVVSLEPFESEFESPIAVDFAGPAETDVSAARFVGEPDDHSVASKVRSAELDAPDPIIDGRIDLGALAAEFLMLALDPHPRKPGVSFDETGFAAPDTEKTSPFAVLGTLRPTSRRGD
jgi:hypothetical protein